MILLSFTLAIRISMLGSDTHSVVSTDYADKLLLAMLGVIAGWGLINGVMYVLLSVFDRGEKHNFLARIQAVATPAEGIEAIAEKLDPILEPITGAGQRAQLYENVLAHLRDSRPRPIGIRRDDLIGGAGCMLVAILSVLPSLAPFVLLRSNFVLALRISNLVSFAMLFAADYGFGHYRRMNPWKTGLALLAAGAVLGLIAIVVEG